MSKVSYFTEEGFNKLKDELSYLKTKGRADMARQIQEARDKGDLSENAEYDAAKDAQGLLELKISKLEATLSNAKVIPTDTNADISKVLILSKVKIQNTANKQTVTYTLVAEEEANLKEGKISIKSPIGMGLLGKKVGDIVEIKIPAGLINFKILEVSR